MATLLAYPLKKYCVSGDKPDLVCVKAAAEVPPSAKALSVKVTPVEVLNTVPLAVKVAGAPAVTVAPKTAEVAVIDDAVGEATVGFVEPTVTL